MSLESVRAKQQALKSAIYDAVGDNTGAFADAILDLLREFGNPFSTEARDALAEGLAVRSKILSTKGKVIQQ